MKINQITNESMQDSINNAFQNSMQYVSGPTLPKPNGNYRLEDVMKRVKELKDALARAKQKGRLNVNSFEYKNVIAELQKWDQWLQDSQDINKWHPERLKEDSKTHQELVVIFKNALATGNLDQWHDLSPSEKQSAFSWVYGNKWSDIVGNYFPSEEQLDNTLYAMIKKRQDDIYHIQIGPEKRAELARMADALAEMQRQQARKEKLEDEAIAYQRFQDEQQRQDAFKKIEMTYQHELKVINTNHANHMEAIKTGNKHEIEKITMAYQEAEREREHSLTTLGQQQQHELTMQQQQQAQRESIERIAKLAGVPLQEAWNPNMVEIYRAANEMATALYSLAILNNPAFRKREDPQGQLYAVLQNNDPEDYLETAELNQRDLADHGAKLTYNSSSPRMFTLHVPNMKPYTFDVKEVVDTAVG